MRDENIPEAIQRGDQQVMAQVMARYSRLLWKVAAGVLKTAPDQDVEECVADAFIHLWRHPEQYDPRRGALKSWLAAIARSRALDRARQLTRRRELPLEEEALGAASPPPEELLDGAEELLSRLEEPDREIFRRRYAAGEKPSEIARELGLPVRRVQNRLYRGKELLRKQLEEEGEEPK